MLAESALGSALDKVTPIKLAGKFWRVVATSSLLGLVGGENGLPEVARIYPNLLFAGSSRRVGGRYTLDGSYHRGPVSPRGPLKRADDGT